MPLLKKMYGPTKTIIKKIPISMAEYIIMGGEIPYYLEDVPLNQIPPVGYKEVKEKIQECKSHTLVQDGHWWECNKCGTAFIEVEVNKITSADNGLI